MAKTLLWLYVISFIILAIVDFNSGKDNFKDIKWNVTLFWGIICTLAICESIEKIGGSK